MSLFSLSIIKCVENTMYMLIYRRKLFVSKTRKAGHGDIHPLVRSCCVPLKIRFGYTAIFGLAYIGFNVANKLCFLITKRYYLHPSFQSLKKTYSLAFFLFFLLEKLENSSEIVATFGQFRPVSLIRGLIAFMAAFRRIERQLNFH
jgi:hypothetical protein